MSSTITATGHQHRLGPFDTDADPSEHDGAIVALAGAILEECQTCHDFRLAAIVASTPALLRLIDLVGRGHTGNTGPLRGLHPSTEPIADLVDLPPTEREAVLERLVDENRAASLTDTAARLLVGAWMPRHIQAENPSLVAATIQQVKDRYHLPEPDADGPAWAWAVLSETTPTSEDTAARRQATVTALHLAATADADNDYLLAPIALGGTGGHEEADLVLTALGWTPAWPPAWPTRGWHQLDGQRRQAMRVRRDAPALAPSAPVPYGDTVQWQLDTDRYYPYDDSTAGPPPGRVRYALQVIARSDHQDEHGQPSPDERTVKAHQTVEAFHRWLHDQIQAHGWPQAGSDFENLSLAVLAWVASDPNEHRRAESTEQLAAAVATGYADPAHLGILNSPMSTAELFDVIGRCYPEA